MIALPLAAVGCVLLAAAGVRLLAFPAFEAPVLVRGGAVEERAPGSIVDRLLDVLGRPIGPRLAGPRGRRALAARLDAAGGLGGVSVDGFLVRRAGGVTLAVAVGTVELLLGQRVVGLAIALVLALRTDLTLRATARRRQGEIDRALPDLLDVLSITVLAGASFRVGLARVAQALPGPLAEELVTTLRQLDVGVSRRSAFEQLRDRNPAPGLRRFVAGVLQAEELGSSLSGTLDEVATDLRRTATQQARKRADSMDKSIALATSTILLPAMILLTMATFFGSIRGR